jgi:putative ABC transport system permease protein
VVGVLKKKGQTFGERMDEFVYLPITAVFSRWVGDRKVSTILAVPEPTANTTRVMDSIWQWLMRHHNNQVDFQVDTLESIMQAITRVFMIFGGLLGSIASLALLVGGIGIMNIMLVSVTERTREIGLRKAVGAKRINILVQFLIEAATLSAIGGLIGMGLGWGIGEAIEWGSKQIEMFGDEGMPFFFPVWAAIVAFAFSAAVGIIFGLYPAWRAARLDPIVALRHE